MKVRILLSNANDIYKGRDYSFWNNVIDIFYHSSTLTEMYSNKKIKTNIHSNAYLSITYIIHWISMIPTWYNYFEEIRFSMEARHEHSRNRNVWPSVSLLNERYKYTISDHVIWYPSKTICPFILFHDL